MRLVMFARVPRWYSFRRDRLATRLQAEGHEVACIVVETMGTLSTLGEWLHKLGLRVVLGKALARVFRRPRGSASPTGAAPRLAPCEARVIHVASHNSDECIRILNEVCPDVLVLRGCRVIHGRVMGIPARGTINPHYAILPAYRGMEVTEWSVLHGDPCAVSVHWVVEAVDAGEVIVWRPIDIRRAKSLGELRERCAAAAADLLAEALRRIESEGLQPKSTSEIGGHQYFEMHPRLYRLAERRLSRTALS